MFHCFPMTVTVSLTRYTPGFHLLRLSQNMTSALSYLSATLFVFAPQTHEDPCCSIVVSMSKVGKGVYHVLCGCLKRALYKLGTIITIVCMNGCIDTVTRFQRLV